jgi:TonB family protein
MWRQFRAPDSSFAIMVPASRPLARRDRDTVYYFENIYSNDSGPIRFAVTAQSHRGGASLKHMPSAAGFCAQCLGEVVGDTTVDAGPREGRWVFIQSDSAGAKVTSVYRVVQFGSHTYIVSASTGPGRPISEDARLFLQSFTLCGFPLSCPVVAESAPPWHAPLFRYLPAVPTNQGETFMGPVDFGQAFLDYQVDDSVVQVRGSAPPAYPAELKAQGIGGQVVAEFVVNKLGRVEPGTIQIVESSNPFLSDAVKHALLTMPFVPARSSNHEVRQLVRRAFVFDVGSP